MNMKWILGVSSVVVGCGASTPGAQPTDMSQVAHEAEAQHHEQEAVTHEGHFDPNAREAVRHCRGSGANRGEPCWTTTKNPTAEHLREADAHRKMAADHRAASKALRDAEASACGDIQEDDRDTSPFEHKDDIVNIQSLSSAPSGGKTNPSPSLQGASVTIRAVPGLTKEYLQRLLTCHLARNASMGFSMPEMAWCPLSVKGANATVESVEGGFRVDIRSDDSQAAQEILHRAEALQSK